MKWAFIFPKVVPHTYRCLTCKSTRQRDLRSEIVTMFCKICRGQRQHQRID